MIRSRTAFRKLLEIGVCCCIQMQDQRCCLKRPEHLPLGKPDVKLVMVVPAHEELLALVVNQQDTIVFLFVLIRKMSPKNYADRGIGTVLALEDIL